MLILTRRIGESVHIGEDIRLTVLGVRDSQVRIGINAPKEVPVHREEIYYRIKHEQEMKAGLAAAGVTQSDAQPESPADAVADEMAEDQEGSDDNFGNV